MQSDSHLGPPRPNSRPDDDHFDQMAHPPPLPLPLSLSLPLSHSEQSGYPFVSQINNNHQHNHYQHGSNNTHRPSGHGHPPNPLQPNQILPYPPPYYPPPSGYPPHSLLPSSIPSSIPQSIPSTFPPSSPPSNSISSIPPTQHLPLSAQPIPAPVPPPPIPQQLPSAYNNNPSLIFNHNQLYNYHHHPSNINYPNSLQQPHPHSHIHLQHHPHPHPHPLYPHPHLVHPSPNISPSHVSSPSPLNQFSSYSPHIRSPSSSDHPIQPFSPFQNSPPPMPLSPFEHSYQHMAIPYQPNQDHPGPAPTTPAHYPQHQLFSPFTSPNPNYDSHSHSHSHSSRPPGYQHQSPLHSPFASPRQNPSRQMRTPARLPHSPRYGPFPHKSPYSSASSPSTQGPRSPSSQLMADSLVRGSLAQAKLRSHVFKREQLPIASLALAKPKPLAAAQSQALHLDRPALPRPPSHSEHALWVGNVPNDATHEELWKFFAEPTDRPGEKEGGAGVESIHLIGRSNCAFVNYISDDHLAEAIGSCNGRPLRPRDPHCKPLVCRVRKPEDNVKSGVGAQRVGGMHRAWVRRGGNGARRGGGGGGGGPGRERERGGKAQHSWPLPTTTSSTTPGSHSRIVQVAPQTDPKLAPAAGVVPSTALALAGEEDQNKRTTSTTSTSNNSNQSLSTSSSFLTRYFPKRYFILKSYTEEDLHLSVSQSIWASQSHNEPILDQAYRTSPSGVYLIFSANRSGEFYGYGRMAGPIWSGNNKKKKRRVSEPVGSQEVMEREEEEQQQQRGGGEVGRMRRASVGTSGKELVGFGVGFRSASPPAISPVSRETRWAGESGQHQQRSLPLTGSRKQAEVRLGSPSRASQSPIGEKGTGEVEDQDQEEEVQENEEEEVDELDEVDEQQRLMSGRPFKVEWIRVQKLAFYKTRELRNPFNGNREVKVSRDGTEVEPRVGNEIVELIEREWELGCRGLQGVHGVGGLQGGGQQGLQGGGEIVGSDFQVGKTKEEAKGEGEGQGQVEKSKEV